jgi:small-conductance mechanosensitive channel
VRLGRALGAAFAVAWLWLGAAPDGRAQQPPAPPPAQPAPAEPMGPPAPGMPAPPTAVPAPDIAVRSEDALRELRAIAEELAPDPAIVAIEQAMEERKAAIDANTDAVEAAVEQRAGLDHLLDLERKLSAIGDEIKSWQTTAKERADRLERRVADLGRLKETWDLTLERAKDESAPDEVLARIREIRGDVRETQKQVQDARNDVLTLQGRVAQLDTSVGLLLDDVHRARFEIRGRLFEADRKPLWGALAKARGFDVVLERLEDSLQRDGVTLRTFATLESHRIRNHLLLFAAFLALAWVLRNWARGRRAAGKQIGPAPRVYERPFSVAALGALVAAPWVYPHAPLVVTGLFGLLLLVPIFRLVMDVLAPELRSLWLVIVGFYLVDRLRYIVQAVELLERSLFLIEMAAAAIFVARLSSSAQSETLARFLDWTPRTVQRALRAVTALFAVAALADVIGLYTLGKVIADGLLTSVYTGIVFYAAVSVVRPMVGAVLGSRPLAGLRAVSRNRGMLERGIGRAIGWIAFIAWGRVLLDRFTVGDPVYEALGWVVTTPVSMGTVSISLGDVLAFVAVVVLTMGLSRAIGVLLEEDVLPMTPLGRGVPHAIARTVSYGIFFVGLLLALGAAGIDLSKVTILAGAFGVGIGFGLQNIVNNFISGLILLYERPIQIGDTVEVGTLTGEVRRIGIRSSTLRTLQGAEVIVPNASLIQEKVVNWTLSDRQRRIDMSIAVPYGAQPATVLALLVDAARSVSEVNEEPEPVALFKGFGDNALHFELRAWTGFGSYLHVQTRVALAVSESLQKNGMAMPAQGGVKLRIDEAS